MGTTVISDDGNTYLHILVQKIWGKYFREDVFRTSICQSTKGLAFDTRVGHRFSTVSCIQHGKGRTSDRWLIPQKRAIYAHDDVIKWKPFLRYWPFARGIHRLPVNSLHKGQWRGALMVSLICVWIIVWVNNREAGDLRRHHAHYDDTVMY